MIRTAAWVAGTLFFALRAYADTDTHIWSGILATRQLDERFSATFDGQLRTTDDASRVGQVLLRPSIGYKLDATTTTSLGYAFVFTDPIGPASTNEHRIWQQLSYRLAGDGKGITLTGRTRLEQRWLEDSGEVGLRLRQQVRVTAPLQGKLRAVAWSEPFVALDDTRWGQRSGLDRWRNTLALSIPVSKGVTIEPGYMNQWVKRRGPDAVHHIANVTVSVNF